MRFTVESDIERPPVFDLLADARNETSWNTQVSRSELVAGDVGAGARFVTVNRGGGSGSHVVGEYEFVPRGAMRVVFPLMQGAVRKDVATQSQNFKQFCEQA